MYDAKPRELPGEKSTYLKDHTNKLETKSKNKNTKIYRGISEFKKCYQRRTNLIADSHSISICGRTAFPAIECSWWSTEL
jgi:hypothetical protein